MKVVKLLNRFFILVALLHCVNPGTAQITSRVDMKTMVEIKKELSRFDELLNSISRQAPVVFSFSSKKIASDKMLKVRTGRQSLNDVLKQINSSTGLYYKVVGNHIIFQDKQHVPAGATAPGTNSRTVRNSTPSRRLSPKSQELKKLSPSSKIDPPDTVKNNRPADFTVGESRIKTAANGRDTLYSEDNTARNFTDQESLDSIRDNEQQSVPQIKKVFGTDTSANKPVSSINGGSSSVISSRSKRERTTSKLTWFPGAELLFTTNAENRSQKLKATGIGIGIKMERHFSSSFSWTVAAHFNYFKGKFSYTSFTGARDTSVNNFASIPIFAGLKYYPILPLYLSFEMGPSIKASSKTTTKLAVTPSAGVLLPLRNGNVVDLGIKYTHVVRGFATPETPGLQAGGYGILSFRLAYGMKRF